MAPGDGGKTSTASKPISFAVRHPASRSSQNTNGPPLASGTRLMVTLDRITKTLHARRKLIRPGLARHAPRQATRLYSLSNMLLGSTRNKQRLQVPLVEVLGDVFGDGRLTLFKQPEIALAHLSRDLIADVNQLSQRGVERAALLVVPQGRDELLRRPAVHCSRRRQLRHIDIDDRCVRGAERVAL